MQRLSEKTMQSTMVEQASACVFNARRPAEACPTIVQACSIPKNLNHIRRVHKTIQSAWTFANHSTSAITKCR
jgi:hypothetical protein